MSGTVFSQQVGIEVPLIGGPMYPCSNPELVAAVSEAGGIGIVQPISLTYVHGYDFREGLRYIRELSGKPIGMNALIEQSSKKYHKRMQQWVDIALEEGVFFFITSLGKPDWVVKKVHAAGGWCITMSPNASGPTKASGRGGWFDRRKQSRRGACRG